MMNSKFLNDSAEVLSNRLKEEAKTVSEQVSRAIELATSRPATKEDIAQGKADKYFHGEWGGRGSSIAEILPVGSQPK